MEITQEERLDLTDEKIRAEKLAFSIELFKNLEAMTNNKKVVMEKDVRDCLLRTNCDLMAENERLKKQLSDYEKALKDYADMSNWFVCYLRHHFIFQKDNYKANELAKEILKKWEE